MRALGVAEDISVQEVTIDLQPADRVLLCTDGLTRIISDESIQAILARQPNPQAASDELVEAANQRRADDNITVIVLDFLQDVSEPAKGAVDHKRARARRPSPTEESPSLRL